MISIYILAKSLNNFIVEIFPIHTIKPIIKPKTIAIKDSSNVTDIPFKNAI